MMLACLVCTVQIKVVSRSMMSTIASKNSPRPGPNRTLVPHEARTKPNATLSFFCEPFGENRPARPVAARLGGPARVWPTGPGGRRARVHARHGRHGDSAAERPANRRRRTCRGQKRRF